MIKFFRKIRYDLMVKNKTGKYFKYAIGEILLVVIGILIALQINNWNSQKKFEHTNILLINKMQDELQININRIHYLDSEYRSEGIASGYTPMLATLDTALVYVNDGLKYEHLIWMLDKPTFYHGNLYNFSNSVYQEMISTGRFYTLGSDSLQKQISLYYQLLDREAQYVLMWNEDAKQAWRECKYSYNDLKEDFDLFGYKSIDNHDWYLDKRSKNYIDLKTALRKSYQSTERNRRHAMITLTVSKSLIEVLEQELESMR